MDLQNKIEKNQWKRAQKNQYKKTWKNQARDQQKVLKKHQRVNQGITRKICNGALINSHNDLINKDLKRLDKMHI